jgi:CDP-paratose 2-epimerase
MMRILVTGGAGFVGSRLALGLAADGHEVVALDNLKRRGSELNIPLLREAGAVFCHGDVRCPEDLNAVAACDLLLACSAEPSVQAGYAWKENSPAYVLDTNLSGAVQCLEYARRNKVGVIFLSSSRVYPIAPLRALPLRREKTRLDLEASFSAEGCSALGVTDAYPLRGVRSLYGATKLSAELLLEEFGAMYGLPYVINRCGVISGPGQMGKEDQGFVALWLARHFWGGELSCRGFGGEGLQVRDVLHIEDLLDLIRREAAALEKYSGAVWNVGGGRENSLSLAELTVLCRELTGRQIPIDSIPETNPADIPWYISDNAAVSAATGWKPRLGLRVLLQDMADWLAGDGGRLRSYFV